MNPPKSMPDSAKLSPKDILIERIMLAVTLMLLLGSFLKVLFF